VHSSPAAATAVLYLPGTHAAHMSVIKFIAPSNPAKQAHCVTTELPLAHNEFCGQADAMLAFVAPITLEKKPAVNGVQLCGPLDALNVPAPHALQDPPLAPVFCAQYPGLHVQFWITPLLAGELEFAGQNSHWLWFVMENLPVSHTRHDSADFVPDGAEYCPAPHCEQSDAFNKRYVPGTQIRHVALVRPISLVQ